MAPRLRKAENRKGQNNLWAREHLNRQCPGTDGAEHAVLLGVCVSTHSFYLESPQANTWAVFIKKKHNQPSPFHTYHCLWGCSGLALSMGLNGSKFKAADKNFPGGPVVKIPSSNAGSADSSPCWGAKIPYAFWPKNQNIKQKLYCNKYSEDFKNGPRQKKKKIFFNIEVCRISYMKRVTSPGSMHNTGCLGLVRWDDPEGWNGEGGGRRV